MPYWSVYCILCHGYIIDALLECIPHAKQLTPAFRELFGMRPGAALACPYCGGLISFDNVGQVHIPEPGWPVFRYGNAELTAKKLLDGESINTTITEWALRHRFTQPGTHVPFSEYIYASKHPKMKLSPEEEQFLHHWMYDEVHYRDGRGPAKRLQLENRVTPADLGVLIAAAMPEPAMQEAAGYSAPPRGRPAWPWTDEALRARLAEARAILAAKTAQFADEAKRSANGDVGVDAV